MVDSYWRRLDDNLNNLENAIQISSILLKLKELDTKINDISNTNETNITSNLKKIDTNKTDIASNFKKIDTNKTDITSNKTKISNIENIKKQVYYDKIYLNFFKNNNKKYIKIIDINIDFSFTNNYIKINSSFNPSRNHTFANFNNIYKFYNDKNELFKEVKLNHNDFYDKTIQNILNNFEIKSDNSQNVKLEIYLENIMDNNEYVYFYKNDNSFIEIKIYKYIDVFNTLDEKIKTNETNITNFKKNAYYFR